MKNIALVDWNWMGHHPTYFRKFLGVLHGLGCEVVPVCPHVALQEVGAWCREYATGATVHPPQATRVPRMRQSVLPRGLRGPEQALRTFSRLGRQLRAWEKNLGKKIDLVFFPTIYDSQFCHFKLAESLFGYPWSGIYLHARAFRLPGSPLPYSNVLPCPEQIFTGRRMSSVCLLDEGVVEPMQELAGGRPVFVLPDVTDESLPADLQGAGLAGKVRAFARGRKLVACLGSLQKTKGLSELCRAATDPRLAEVCFFFGGEVYWGGMDAEEIDAVQRVWEKAPNVMTHLARISADAVINSLVDACDVIFAAYKDFPNSSNIMTKAAVFRRPVIVSDGFLMAERVRQHGTGRVVPERDVEAIVCQILSLCRGEDPQPQGFEHYHARHSMNALEASMRQVIDRVPGDPAQ